LELVKKTLKEGHIVISDDLNYYTSMRHDLKRIAEDMKINFFIIHISTPISVCLKWNENRGNPIPSKIIKDINKKFDNFGKYNWEIAFAKFDLSRLKHLDNSIEDLINKILQNIKSAKEIKEKEKITTLKSNLYNEQLDKITRDIVGDLLRNPNFHSLKKKIIRSRKIFVKTHVNILLNKIEIAKRFRDYLEKRLNVKLT